MRTLLPLLAILAGCGHAPPPEMSIREKGLAPSAETKVWVAPLANPGPFFTGDKIAVSGRFTIGPADRQDDDPIFEICQGTLTYDQGFDRCGEPGPDLSIPFTGSLTCPKWPGKYQVLASITVVRPTSIPPGKAAETRDVVSAPIAIEVKTKPKAKGPSR